MRDPNVRDHRKVFEFAEVVGFQGSWGQVAGRLLDAGYGIQWNPKTEEYEISEPISHS